MQDYKSLPRVVVFDILVNTQTDSNLTPSYTVSSANTCLVYWLQ